jgi:hypothetical protein
MNEANEDAAEENRRARGRTCPVCPQSHAPAECDADTAKLVVIIAPSEP